MVFIGEFYRFFWRRVRDLNPRPKVYSHASWIRKTLDLKGLLKRLALLRRHNFLRICDSLYGVKREIRRKTEAP
jgi:hypothetical protein